jgi:hypothetical protein
LILASDEKNSNKTLDEEKFGGVGELIMKIFVFHEEFSILIFTRSK